MNSSATEADQREFLLIEAFRGFAAFLVVYTHFWALSPGSPSLLRFAHTGVDLFFVLSGYVFGPYFSENRSAHQVPLRGRWHFGQGDSFASIRCTCLPFASTSLKRPSMSKIYSML